MRAVAVFPAARELRIVEHPSPALDSPTAVRLRMIEAGVCGTDREICSFEYGTPPPGSDYLVLGHESLGQVVETGAAVTRVAVGDLVVPMVRRPCPHPECAPCRGGRQDFCVTGDYVERGIRGAHGFMTEQVVDDERWMNRVPAALRDVGVLVEPLTIAEKALLQVALVQRRLPWEARREGEGDAEAAADTSLGSDPAPAAGQAGRRHRALVIGAGPVGLLGAMALRVRGFETLVYSRSLELDGRAALVESLGARAVAAERVAPADLPGLAGTLDLVYEAAGASQAAFEVLGALGANGAYVFTGVPGRKGPVAVDTDALMRGIVLRNQVVLGTVNAGRDAFEAAIRDLGEFRRRWPDALRALIRRAPLETFADAIAGRSGGIKNVLELGG